MQLWREGGLQGGRCDELRCDEQWRGGGSTFSSCHQFDVQIHQQRDVGFAFSYSRCVHRLQRIICSTCRHSRSETCKRSREVALIHLRDSKLLGDGSRGERPKQMSRRARLQPPMLSGRGLGFSYRWCFPPILARETSAAASDAIRLQGGALRCSTM